MIPGCPLKILYEMLIYLLELMMIDGHGMMGWWNWHNCYGITSVQEKRNIKRSNSGLLNVACLFLLIKQQNQDLIFSIVQMFDAPRPQNLRILKNIMGFSSMKVDWNADIPSFINDRTVKMDQISTMQTMCDIGRRVNITCSLLPVLFSNNNVS